MRGGMCLFPLLILCLPRSCDFSSGMWHVHGRKLRFVSDSRFYLTPGNSAGNWVVEIADWFVFVLEFVNWVSNLRKISNGPDVCHVKMISDRPTSSIKETFDVRKDFLVKEKWKHKWIMLAGTVGRGASSQSYVWRVIIFWRFTECIIIAFMAVC
jgi:hypothetical protein